MTSGEPGGAGSTGSGGGSGGGAGGGPDGGSGRGRPPTEPRPPGPVRSWLTGPRGARLVGAVFAVAGVALLVIGLITLRGGPSDEGRPPAAGTTAPGAPTQTPTAAPTTRPSGTPTRGTSAPPTRPPPGPAPVVPLTVLNNSTQPGLAELAAARFQAAGWPVALVGNFAGRIPSTTVYYAPGDTAQQRAAQALATQFKGIHRVMPRYSGLPPTPPGLVVVVTRDWTG